ncbi:hypothetical protein BpHYR1_016987 [Brachionus plicatilis]|uniref:ABC-2 type transporter transmembrane domain-containing protein n=1 Tax=Brachionus plicatilis TaxID=10195 RepID=A0A3M7QMI5_BRAPC|nr:hypothetical protein BpHYR1_016987 [Brachionus plicatilis]
MAKSIVYYLKKLTDRGKTIICTIHQPSSETFAIFDKICLLSQTKVAFFGTRENGLKFFEENLHLKCPPFTNPADFYMDTLGVDVNDIPNSRAEILGYCDKYAISEYSFDLSRKIDSVKPEYFSSPANYTSYKSTWLEQMTYLLQRSFFNYIRNRKVVLNDILMVFLPVYLILPTIHATIIYYMVGFDCDKNSFSVFLLTDILISNAAFSLGHILSVSTSDANFAISLTSPFIAIQMLFSGFFLRRAVRTPKFLSYIKYGSIFNYGYDLLMLNHWENVSEIECEYDIELLCLTTGGSVLNEEKIRRKNKIVLIIMLFFLNILFRLTAYLILWAKGRRSKVSYNKLFKKLKSKFTINV